MRTQTGVSQDLSGLGKSDSSRNDVPIHNRMRKLTVAAAASTSGSQCSGRDPKYLRWGTMAVARVGRTHQLQLSDGINSAGWAHTQHEFRSRGNIVCSTIQVQLSRRMTGFTLPKRARPSRKTLWSSAHHRNQINSLHFFLRFHVVAAAKHRSQVRPCNHELLDGRGIPSSRCSSCHPVVTLISYAQYLIQPSLRHWLGEGRGHSLYCGDATLSAGPWQPWMERSTLSESLTTRCGCLTPAFS